MANPEHLKILKQGVETWNQWRKENPDIKPDLANANLVGMNLIGINLRNTKLIKTNLSKANLSESDLSKANLIEAILCEANLHGVKLIGLFSMFTNFFKANLSDSKCIKTQLMIANLSEANLYRGDFSEANFLGANLSGANLFKSNLRYSTLIKVNLMEAKLTGIKLYGSSRDDWNIEGVKCDYVYWDRNGEIRSPKMRDFAPSEFEQLYKTLPIIEYIFQNGMLPIDPLIMDRVVQAIRENKPEFDLRIDSINARGLAPSIKFTVQQEEHKEPALQEITREYETRIQCLEEERDRCWQTINRFLDAPREMKLINAAPGSIVATDGSTINIEQHIHNAIELQKAIAQEPKESKSFLKIAKDKALDIVGGALEDIAKGELKKAAKAIYELGKLVGPLITKTAAYAYFKGLVG